MKADTTPNSKNMEGFIKLKTCWNSFRLSNYLTHMYRKGKVSCSRTDVVRDLLRNQSVT